ncbi:MAG: hypothetical protein AAF899_12335 [Pseudomonadota bacterium]
MTERESAVAGGDFGALDADLAAAVEAGVIDEAQAAGVAALARARQARRDVEPFAFFRGLNDLFVALGVALFLAATVALAFPFPATGVVMLLLFIALAEIITARRRMIAPSLVLAVAVPVTAVLSYAGFVTDPGGLGPGILDALHALAMVGIGVVAALGFYLRYRLPFALFVVGIAVYTALVVAWSVIQSDGLQTGILTLRDVRVRLALDAAWIGIGCGVAGFVTAMAFDARDPLRVTRLAHCGFWLHVLSATALVNGPVFLLRAGDAFPVVEMLAVVLLAALVALIVDRRAFVMAGVATQGAILFALLDAGAESGRGALALGLLGGGVVVLGLSWRALRRGLFRILPSGSWRAGLPPVAA